MSSKAPEFISGVSFAEAIQSLYVKPTRMFFNRRGKNVVWDLAFAHDSVAVLLYHKTKNAILLVKQFRPAVFVSKIRRLAENKDKNLNEIEWTKYPISTGETLELCAGIMDKPTHSPLETAREEILEECGYSVPVESIKHVHSFTAGVGLSGAQQYLYYAEIDEEFRVSNGGGVEGEIIQKVFLGVDEAKKLLENKEAMCPTGLIFAFHWFFNRRSQHMGDGK